MWTKHDALSHIIDNELKIASLAFGSEYTLQDDLTEVWDGGWIFQFSPVEGEGYDIRYLAEKTLERCVLIGTAGVDRAIEKCYRNS